MSLVRNERLKPTATYPNAAANAFLTAGVVAPLAATVFGLTASLATPSRLILAAGIPIFLIVIAALHAAARHALNGLRP